MRALLLTNEYPPNIYGGAGVHVDYLSRELARLCRVEVRCFGQQDLTAAGLRVRGYENPASPYGAPASLHRVFDAVQRCLDFNASGIDADLVHVHTWYTHLGGILAKLNYGIPLVLTVHSLEPLRPWKKEQLGNGYTFTSWVEKTAIGMADAVVAVSRDTKKDILALMDVPASKVHVIPNGIDPDEYKPVRSKEGLSRLGIDPAKPYVLFVGRITRQKGIIHLVNAIPRMRKDFQVVLCASAPDTPQIAREMEEQIRAAQAAHPSVIWLRDMIDTPAKILLYSHASVFCCPSVYEPFGIINLEAMACETPVVATAVGGIKEVVENGRTGCLVPVKRKDTSSFEPADPGKFSRDLAEAVNRLMADTALQARFGQAGRRRVLEHFTWEKVAAQTFALYERLAASD